MAKGRHFNLIKYDDVVSKGNVQVQNKKVEKKSIPPVKDTTRDSEQVSYSVEDKLEILRERIEDLKTLLYNYIYPPNKAMEKVEYNSVTTEQLKLAINKKKEELTLLEAKLASIKQFPVLDDRQSILNGLVNKDF